MTPATPLFEDLFAIDDFQRNPSDDKDLFDKDPKGANNDLDDTDLDDQDLDGDDLDGSDNHDGEDDGNEGDDNDDADNGISEYQAFHDILASDGIIEPIENYDGSKEMLAAHLETLPEQYFLQAVSEIAKPVQPLMQYVFTKGSDASIEDAYRFFQQHVVPAHNLGTLNIDDEEVAYEYLKSKLSTLTVFKNPEKLTSHLDGLAIDGSLVEIAKEQYTAEKANIAKEAQAEIDAANAKKLETQEKTRKMGEAVITELARLPWQKDTKDRALASLKPENIQATYAAIYENPKAILQLGAFFANFDAKTGTFDLSAYAKQIASSTVVKEKDKIQKSTLDSHLNRVATTQKGGAGKTSARLQDDLVER